jgi:DNA-binding GntR family transcriptional regulator
MASSVDIIEKYDDFADSMECISLTQMPPLPRLSDNVATGMTGPFQLVPASLRSTVEDQIRQAIMTGDLPPGLHLSDRMMCERFGVSRTVVREAIRLLEAEGLVTVLPRRGPFVAFLTAAEAVQIYEVREALEALAGQGFAERASDAERRALRDVVVSLEAASASAGHAALLDHKRAFYAILLQGCRNAYAARMLGLLLNRNMQLRATSLSAPNRLPNTIRELWRVVEAIEQRDGEGAAIACRDHVRAAAAVALRVLRSRATTKGNPA